jgi:COMPASS component SWD3
MNILTVRTQVLPVTNFEDGEYSKGSMTTIVTGSADKSVRLTSLLTGEPYNSLDVHTGGVPCVDFHPVYPTLMLSASLDATAALFEMSSNQRIQVFKDDHTRPISRARFSPDGSMFVTASLDRPICFYRLQLSPQTPMSPITPATPRSPMSRMFDGVHYAKVHTMQFSGKPEALCFLPDGRYLVVAVRDDNYLHYIDLNSYEDTVYNMNENGDDYVSFTAMDLSASPHNDGRYLLVSTDRNGRLILFRTHSSEQLRNFYGVPNDELFTPRHCWHPSGKYFFVNDGDDWSVSVFDVASGRVCAKLHGHKGVVRDLWYDAEKDLLLTCGYDKSVRVWGPDEVPKSPVRSEGSR